VAGRILGAALNLSPQDVPITLAAHGKPVLDAPFSHLHFNLSHCSDLALVALCGDGPVGVDLESVSRAVDLTECETAFCHPDEIRDLPLHTAARASRLLDIWTAKEALLKSRGTGLLHPPEKIRLRFAPSGLELINDSGLPEYSDHVLEFLDHAALTSYRAALSRPASANRIEIILPLESTNVANFGNHFPANSLSDG
jgi:phosphopantetheinyl transferase